MPQVSIIIAIYNVAPYLEKCLASVANQSFRDVEIIAVNDGSTDACGSILEQWARKEPRMVLVDKTNGGLSDARNAGLAVARGKYIAFLDGDDSYEPDFIDRMLAAMQQTDADLVCCNYAYTYHSGRRREVRDYLRNLSSNLTKTAALQAFLREEIIASVAIKLFRRELIERTAIRFPKGKLWEDITFTFEYLKQVDKVAIVPEALYNYFQSEVSITRTKETLCILDFIEAASNCVAWVEDNYEGTYARECSCFFTKAFICLLVYSFKCRDKAILARLKQELKTNSPRTAFSLLRPEEKILITCYRIDYRLARLAYWCTHKNDRKEVAA